MGERVRADIQAEYELRSGWKINDAISGLVVEIDGASKFSTTATAAEIGLDQKLLRLSSSLVVTLLSTSARHQSLESLLSISLSQ